MESRAEYAAEEYSSIPPNEIGYGPDEACLGEPEPRYDLTDAPTESPAESDGEPALEGLDDRARFEESRTVRWTESDAVVDEPELVSDYVFPASWAAARSELAAAERRAAATVDESRVLAESIRLRGRQEARAILMRAEDRAQQILELANAEADATERRAQLESEAILLEAQVRLDVFTQDFGAEPPPVDEPPREEPLVEAALDASPMLDLEAPDTIAEAEERPQFTEAQAETFAVAAPPEATALDDGVSEPSSDVDDAQPAIVAPEPEPEPTVDEVEVLYVAPLAIVGDTAIYRVTGPLTFARIMALERALAGLGGVTSSSVKPESAGAATISFVSAEPETTIDHLLNVPGLAIRKARS